MSDGEITSVADSRSAASRAGADTPSLFAAGSMIRLVGGFFEWFGNLGMFSWRC